MKVNGFDNLEIALKNSIWATQAHNEIKLNEAYYEGEVVLVFSVNNSRHFQGYARMASRIGSRTSSIWANNQRILGGLFRVEWVCVRDLTFRDTEHLRNPYNDGKPVKISRDGQEIEPEIAFELCRLMDNSKDSSLSHYMYRDTEKEEEPERKSLPPPRPPVKSSMSIRLNEDENSHTIDRKDEYMEHDQEKPSEKYPEMDLLNMTYEDYLKSRPSSKDSSSKPSSEKRPREKPHRSSRSHPYQREQSGRHEPSSSRSRGRHSSRDYYGESYPSYHDWYNQPMSEVEYMNYLMWLKQYTAYGYYGKGTSYDKNSSSSRERNSSSRRR